MQNKIKVIIISFIVLITDFITKYLFKNKEIVLINNFFKISYVRNYGAAWSILMNQRLLLIALGIIFLICLIKYYSKFKNNIRNTIAFGLTMGGLIGNLFDRLIYGYVRDFISFQFGKYHYPIFNIADIAIVIGILLLVIAIIKKEDSNAKD